MADSWFNTQGVTATGQVSQQQADTINRLMNEGASLSDIAAATGLPASLIQSLSGYQTNGANNQGGAEEQAATTTTAATTSTTDPIAYIRQWQKDHPQASPQAFQELAADLKTKFGIDRWDVNGTPSNNEFNINGQKIKAYSEGGNSWYDPGGLSDEGSGSSTGAQSLANFTAPTYSMAPYQQPAPFSYAGYTPGDPFKPPSAEDVINSPNVQFMQQEGTKALESGASARGTLLTGGTSKDLATWLKGLYSTEYDKEFNRDLNTWGANEDQRMNAYTTDRNNAYQNYALNLGAGQTGYGLNASTSLNAFNANQSAQNQAYNQTRTSGLDIYNQGQDYINNLFRYSDVNQGYTGVPYYSGRSYV